MELIKTILKIILGLGSIHSFGQYGEDAVAAALLRKKKTGVYVDVGAYHPVTYSNTFALYRRGWSGLVVEPNPKMNSLFRFFRPRDTFVGAAIGKRDGVLKYNEYKNGAFNTFKESQIEEIAEKNHVRPVFIRTVPVRTLASILIENRVSHIDLLSVDVEGMDLEVLESHDWSIRPELIIIEDHHFESMHPEASPVCRYLLDKGYALIGKAGPSLFFGTNE